MNKTPFATLAGLLLTVITGCQSVAPAHVAGPSAIEPKAHVVAAPVRSEKCGAEALPVFS